MNGRHGAPMMLLALVTASVAAAGLTGLPPRVAGAPDAAPPTLTTEPARDVDRRARSELSSLARAWADGGGTFGYPFWAKAAQRWRRGEVTASMFREYVTGYRDRLVLGCDLLEEVEVSTDASGEVRRLVVDACRSRLDALRDQQRGLDASIRAKASTDADDVEELQASATEHELETADELQESFRGTRMAMNIAQARIEGAGLAPLREDAFL